MVEKDGVVCDCRLVFCSVAADLLVLRVQRYLADSRSEEGDSGCRNVNKDIKIKLVYSDEIQAYRPTYNLYSGILS